MRDGVTGNLAGTLSPITKTKPYEAHRCTHHVMGRDAMTMLGLRQAAQQAGVSKSTILRAIRAGRLSGTRTEDGGYAIDPAELFRVYPPDVAAQRCARQGLGRGPANGAADVSASTEAISRVAVQEAELAGARQLITFLRT